MIGVSAALLHVYVVACRVKPESVRVAPKKVPGALVEFGGYPPRARQDIDARDATAIEPSLTAELRLQDFFEYILLRSTWDWRLADV
jgi:hypothetical protein